MNAPASSATSFTALPHALQLSCFTLLPLEDILAIGATSHDMRQLCADDMAWRAIFEDLADRCGLRGIGRSSAQKQRNLEKRKTQMEQLINYKHKTLTHVLAFFEEERERAEEVIDEAMAAERESGDCGGVGLCFCECHYGGDSADAYCDCCDAKLSDFDYWGEEECAADEKINRLWEHTNAIRKALKQHT